MATAFSKGELILPTEEELLEVVPGQWSKERVNAWYDELPWLVGCNYYPATAINQIDMWQDSTFDLPTIKKELELAASIGMNTLRVYLHDMVWADDAEGLYDRMDQFLDVCKQNGIRPSFVFFDDCHYPDPKLGPQPLPVYAWHNSGWLNSPARAVAVRFSEGTASEEEVAQLKGYVQETIRRFKDDDRVLYWELYNEPGRGSGDSGDMQSTKRRKGAMGNRSRYLVYYSWVWAREENPSQPITSTTAGCVGDQNIYINRINSDLHSIHSYHPSPKFDEVIAEYKKDDRPVIMTEWLARSIGQDVEECLDIMKRENVGAINWGFVSGKTATIWPWSSRKQVEGANKFDSVNLMRKAGKVINPGDPYPEPKVWFHDLFRPDHTPYRAEEIEAFKRLTGKE
ncbi:MAG: cellulase family glycosylhydrolase [Verrucomicrobiota bacterium]